MCVYIVVCASVCVFDRTTPMQPDVCECVCVCLDGKFVSPCRASNHTRLGKLIDDDDDDDVHANTIQYVYVYTRIHAQAHTTRVNVFAKTGTQIECTHTYFV